MKLSLDNRPELFDNALGSADDLQEYLRVRNAQGAVLHSHENVGQMLLNEGVVDKATLQEALQRKRRDPRMKLADIVDELGASSAELTHLALAHRLNLPIVNLDKIPPDPAAAALLPVDLARRYRALPIMFRDKRLIVALEDPLDLEAVDTIQFITNRRVDTVVARWQQITEALRRFYPSEMDASSSDLFSPAERENETERDEQTTAIEEAERLAQEKPIVRLVNGIISDAVRRLASDIHIRPLRDEAELLYRIDGQLVAIRKFSIALLPAVVSRIKVLGRMNIAERRAPQDGQTRFSHGDHFVDLRISTMPTIFGESVVMRLLDSAIGLKSIGALGFLPVDQKRLIDQLGRTSGLILVTGPTGSGKSTTLYACLQLLKKGNNSIITIEDPVEFKIPGIAQVQVNKAAHLDFATAVRHILRHDPDVIMVGEIRDRETAKVAFESALTGHLVLSSLHTNDAAGAIARLIEMGVEPFLISATVRVIIAQRLMRVICAECKTPADIDPNVRQQLGVPEDLVLYHGTGCDACNKTGYRGRVASYEMIVTDDTIRHLIDERASRLQISTAAIKAGMVPFNGNTLRLVKEGVTTVEEYFRVILD
ncbi:MAG: type II/IV secretion system protein [Chromatiales bacterium]|nr:type II/IV secretion system protein [Gammaproteobacteria bacterium]MCP5230761.1 type II/IV secretion system protein [Zoogloeaceae bacterium]MCP5351943.1 type II/IV secretion system protein [Chromatiales bacterium]